MHALIIGGDSRLGSALQVRLEASTAWRQVITTSRRAASSRGDNCLYMDLADPSTIVLSSVAFAAAGEVAVFVVAAVPGFGPCERGGDTWRINADAPGEIARQTAAWGWQGWRTIFVSSDAVEVAPHTAYALQKAYAELAVLAAGGCVVRPARIATPEAYGEVAALLERCARDRGFRGVARWPE